MNNKILEILRISFRLGITSFGGPIAHLGYFHEEYVRRRKWVDERSYADLVALCQFLPGPASSQVGIALGTIRGGLIGGLAAWIGFTLPSVVALVLFASIVQELDISQTGWTQGLKLVAVAVVAHAILGMSRNLTPDRKRATIAIVTAVIILLFGTTLVQVVVIVMAGLLGLMLFRTTEVTDAPKLQVTISRRLAIICLSLFFLLLIVLPLLNQISDSEWLAVFDSFFRVGSLVFGGGHVVLPLLESEVVSNGWVTEDLFIAGYGAAQAVPGPLFTFASYLGATMNGWQGAIVATVAIFLPSFLLVIGVLPFWDALRRRPKVQSALLSINAAVVGILLAALYDPLWTSTIHRPIDFCFAVAAFGMLSFWKVPAWVVVIFFGIIGGALIL